MSKQELIEQAYGEYYAEIKDYVSADGFISTHLLPPKLFDKVNCKSINYRPKELEGLHDNNGWIKTSESLPIEEFETNKAIKVWSSILDREQILVFPYSVYGFNKEDFRNKYSHWKRIAKDRKPLY